MYQEKVADFCGFYRHHQRLKKSVEEFLPPVLGCCSATRTGVPMGRKSTHRVSLPHPHRRFADKITMLNFRRGPADDIWGASFRIDGKWQPKDGVSLGTRDFEEGAELARDKYALLTAGQPIVKPRVTQPKTLQHAFRIYADRAIAKLKVQADEADARVKGKGHNFRSLAGRIENDLLPRWGDTPITVIGEHDLNEWVRLFRVEDREATVAKFGRQQRSEARQVLYKAPTASTLGNIDWALRMVWDEAVADCVVDRRKRPIIDKSIGEDGEPRAFIDQPGVQAVMRTMTDEWMATSKGHGTDLKRMLRCYIAMIACTGIRAGLEAKRVRLGDVRFTSQHGRQVIFIRVTKYQGKHPKPRSVVVFEGNSVVRIRHLLANHIEWRRSQGGTDTDYLFAWPDGRLPSFRDVLDSVLSAANALNDPMTGEKRVSYSFRNYFATLLIERGHSVAHIAEWLGTSSAMVERHYNRFLVERRAHLVNGAPGEDLDFTDEDGTPWHWDAAIGEHGEWVPG
jgi:integrase